MFFIDKHNKIVLTKGDCASLNVAVKTAEGEEYHILPSDTITLTVKKNAGSQASFQKTATADHKIVFDSSDTSSLTPGLYVYDVQLTNDTGAIYTIVPQSFFEIVQEVG